MSLDKSSGITDSEKLLSYLCNETFLGFWSYPNVYRNQGPKGLNHELVDLLVICGSEIILFSDKTCCFPQCSDAKLAWVRWYKRAIRKSAEQIFGAERWLKEHPHRIFLDPACTHRVPVSIDNVANCRFHRIVVANGAKEACRSQIGGSGSFLLNSRIKGPEHCDTSSPQFQPFSVGAVMPERGWVHVFDDVSLPLLLTELDTIADFINYLTARESLLCNDSAQVVVAGEENLLAFLLSSERVGFMSVIGELLGTKDAVLIDDCIWGEFCSSGIRESRRTFGEISRQIWDAYIIKDFATHAFQGTLYPGSPKTVGRNERILRYLATESRIARSFLTSAMLDRCFSSDLETAALRVVESPTHADVAYAFVFYPARKKHDKRNRTLRQALLLDYLLVCSARMPEKTFVGIATESGNFPYRTFDISVQCPIEWDSEMKKLKDQAIRRVDPQADAESRSPARYREDFMSKGRVRRNELCPCGSGRKYKLCCMRKA